MRRPATGAVVLIACLIAGSCSPSAKKNDPALDTGAGSGGGPGGGSTLAIEITEWDFGSIKRGETATRGVALTNDGAAAIEVTAHSTCNCLTAEPESQMLGPGESASLLLSFLGEDIKEKATKTIYIETGDAAASRVRITVTGRVERGDGPHLQCLPSPLLLEKTGGIYEPAMLRVTNRGRADLTVSEILCFGCDTSEKAFTLGDNEEIEIEVSLADGWTGNRWLEVLSNDPVKATRKISLVVLE
jgi:hypothetical protein